MGNVIPLRRKDAADLTLKISTSDGHPGRVTNVKWTWGEFAARLQRPTRDSLTLKQFKALSDDAQLRRKNNGYFVGAHFKNGIRKRALMGDRSILTFDVDQGTPTLLADLDLGTSGLGDLEYVVYSTRKHSADAPRIRIVIPLQEPLDRDKFEPVSRILAQKLDPEMMAVDRVSFVDAQFMYWPSVCKGEEFCYIHNRGKLLDAEAVLADFGKWEDYENLPRSPREGAPRKADEKAPDPRLKNNAIGAFCRINSIHDCIEKYLPELYSASEWDQNGTPTRYTYTKGSTANGVVVYDDGQYLYSHHGTDPCGGRLVNAFDLRRIHEFNSLDDKAEADTPVNKLPSFAALLAVVGEDPEVAAEMLASNYQDDDSYWDDVIGDEATDDKNKVTGKPVQASDKAARTPTPRKTPEGHQAPPDQAGDPDWRDRLDVTKDGVVRNTMPNLVLILEHAPHFRGRLGYDEFLNEGVVLKEIKSRDLQLHAPGPPENGVQRMTKRHLSTMRVILEAPRGKGKPGWGLKASQRDLEDAYSVVSARHRVHPVRDWLGTLEWDGVERMDRLWIKACHTPDNPYFRQTARMWMTAAVARVHEPGCKFDFAPIIEGPQGLFKSTLLSILGSVRWTGETEGHFDDPKRFVESTQGFWIVEIPELVQFQRSEVEAIKACLSRRSDHVRLSYEPFAQTYHRQHVMAGTTNQSNYLKDKTGNRRFWPIPCGPGQINTAWVQKYRDQLWAEAVVSYRAMRRATNADTLPLYLSDPQAAAYALELQGERVVEDATGDLAGMIEQFLNTPVPATLAACGAEPGDHDSGLYDDNVPLVRRDRTCGIEIWERVMSGRISDFSQKQAWTIRAAMQQVPGWTLDKKRKRAGRYGSQQLYLRDA